MQYKSPDECGDGYPRTLKGLTRVFVEVKTGLNADEGSKDRIVSEIEKAGLGLELLNSLENAQIVLRFRADFFGGGPNESLLGITYCSGWVYLVQGEQLREVFAFHDEKQSFVTLPATNFGRSFVRECRRANGR